MDKLSTEIHQLRLLLLFICYIVPLIICYRASIGCFDSTRQLNLRAIFSKLILGSHISNRGALRLLKLVPFFAVSVYMFIILLIAGDVETNPGPIKIIQGPFYQGESTIWRVCWNAMYV